MGYVAHALSLLVRFNGHGMRFIRWPRTARMCPTKLPRTWRWSDCWTPQNAKAAFLNRFHELSTGSGRQTQ